MVFGHAWSEFDFQSPSFGKKNPQGTWNAEFESIVSGRTFRVSGLFQNRTFPLISICTKPDTGLVQTKSEF